jgi:hypothetical protein
LPAGRCCVIARGARSSFLSGRDFKQNGITQRAAGARIPQFGGRSLVRWRYRSRVCALPPSPPPRFSPGAILLPGPDGMGPDGMQGLTPRRPTPRHPDARTLLARIRLVPSRSVLSTADPVPANHPHRRHQPSPRRHTRPARYGLTTSTTRAGMGLNPPARPCRTTYSRAPVSPLAARAGTGRSGALAEWHALDATLPLVIEGLRMSQPRAPIRACGTFTWSRNSRRSDTQRARTGAGQRRATHGTAGCRGVASDSRLFVAISRYRSRRR